MFEPNTLARSYPAIYTTVRISTQSNIALHLMMFPSFALAQLSFTPLPPPSGSAPERIRSILQLREWLHNRRFGCHTSDDRQTGLSALRSRNIVSY